jgi:hypothetical protein
MNTVTSVVFRVQTAPEAPRLPTKIMYYAVL